MSTIISRKQGNNTYYLHQETYRVKIDPENSGKTRGSGKSKVISRTTYLGSAGKILECVQKKRSPVKVKVRHFGLIAAAYQTAHEIGLPQILMKHIQGSQGGVPLWIYFFVTIINRLDHATSKNKMSKWLKKTPLPELMGFNPKKLTSKNFWYATDEVISENKFQNQREKDDDNDPFAALNEDTLTTIETEVFSSIDELMNLDSSVICYDTTNFYTYIEEPKRSELANTCHSKDSKHHLKHIGLLMAVEKSYGIPLISRVYRANTHDSKVFSSILADLIITLKKLCGSNSDLVLVFDKGNNKKEIFTNISPEIFWVGALVPFHYEDLIELELSAYHGTWKDLHYYRCEREAMGVKSVVVLTFNKATRRKQEYSLKRGIEKLKREIRRKWESYKKTPEDITQGINTMKKKSSYGGCLKISRVEGKLHFDEMEEEIENRKKRFGKSLIFSNMLRAETGYLIDTYNEKNIIEDDFQLLKDPMIIRFRPIRHWTDSKIRAFAFCCVVSMTLIRVMQWMVEQEVGYKMSPNLLKEELSDIQEVVMVYSLTEAERKITDRSAVQEKLWKTFNLEQIKEKMSLH